MVWETSGWVPSGWWLGCALVLMGCGSSASNESAGGAGGGASLAGGPSRGGTPANGGGGSDGGSAAGSGNVDGLGGSVGWTPVDLAFSWATYQVQGTTKSPLTCFDIGAGTLGMTIAGESLERAENTLSSNGEFCDSGHYDHYRWEYGPGKFQIIITLLTGFASDNDNHALVSGSAEFTVLPTDTQLTLPEIQLIRIMMPYSWSIQKAGSAATCADVSASEVDFQLADISENRMLTVNWTDSCSASPTVTPVTPGSWDLIANLKSGGSTIATWKSAEKLTFSYESAAIPPPIVFDVP